MELVFGILLLVMALVLVVAVSLQSSKEKGLSGAIAGGADNGSGKGGQSRRDFFWNRVTTVVSVVFVLVVIAMYIVVS